MIRIECFPQFGISIIEYDKNRNIHLPISHMPNINNSYSNPFLSSLHLLHFRIMEAAPKSPPSPASVMRNKSLTSSSSLDSSTPSKTVRKSQMLKSTKKASRSFGDCKVQQASPTFDRSASSLSPLFSSLLSITSIYPPSIS